MNCSSTQHIWKKLPRGMACASSDSSTNRATDVQFPESARNIKAPFDAIVVVGLVVDASAMPRSVRVVHSYKPDFDAKALQAVKEYRFAPAKRW